MENRSVPAAAVLGLLLAAGLALAGWTFGRGVAAVRAEARHVVVKGLAEREVDADLAIWPVAFQEAGDDLVELQRRVDARRELVTAFLVGNGFAAGDVSLAAPRITDLQAERAGIPGTPRFRFLARAVVTVRSKDVARVRAVMERAGALVAQGVALATDWENRPQFLFPGLNAVKPAMIEEATVAARAAAAQFAKDSGSRVGKIRSASQGLFTVEDRDPNSPERKIVRVVTTVAYFLDD
jgi:hypothetical protein